MSAGREFENYERLVHKILEEKIREEYPSATLQVFHNRKCRGQSGQEHQIDVSAQLTLAGCRVLILAECKKYRGSVGTEDVLTFLARLRDIGASKGILVTPVGYQPGVKRIAEANGIALVLAKSEDSVSWEVVMPILIPPFLVAGAELVARGYRRGEAAPSAAPLTPWIEGGSSTWSRGPDRLADRPLMPTFASRPAANSIPQSEVRIATPKSFEVGAVSEAPAVPKSASIEPPKSPRAPTPVANAVKSGRITTAQQVAGFTLGQSTDPKDEDLAAIGLSLVKGTRICLTPLVHSAIFGSVWPFNPRLRAIPFDRRRPLAELASTLEELVPKGPCVDKIVAVLSKYEGRRPVNKLPGGLPFSLEFAPDDTFLSVGSGPLSQVYLSHIAFWIAVYGDPDLVTRELLPQLRDAAYADLWMMSWPNPWFDYQWWPYGSRYHIPFAQVSYQSLFMAARGKPDSKKEFEVPWKLALERVLELIVSRELPAEGKAVPPSYSVFLNNLYVWSWYFQVKEVNRLLEKILQKCPEMPPWEPLIRFIV